MTDDPAYVPSRGRRIIRLSVVWTLLLVVIPVAALLAAEGILRATGFGEARTPFVTRTVSGKTFYLQNPGYYAQFFETPPFAEGFAVPEEKEDTAYRILVLGGSAAQGWPDPRFAFHGLLELQLQAAFPGVDFQIINAALAGLNLNAMRPIADSVHGLGIDMVLVYCGNNEFEGPFGLESHYRTGSIPSADTIRSLIAAQNFRLVQWAQRHVPAFLRKEGNHIADPRSLKPAIYKNFHDNLMAIVNAAVEMHALPVLCTVPVNLREWPPLHSQTTIGLDSDALARWTRHNEAGRVAQEAGDIAEAIAHYQAAMQIDDAHAGLHYRLAQCLVELEIYGEARTHFEEAAELDESTFVRCKPAQNDIIMQVAVDTGAVMCDLAKIGGASPSNIPGMDLFYDSCHPTFEGTYVVAMALLNALTPHLQFPSGIVRTAPDLPKVLSLEEAKAVLDYNPRVAIDHFDRLLSTPDTLPEGTEPYLQDALTRLRAEEGADLTPEVRLNVLRDAVSRCGVSPLLLMPLTQLLLEARDFEAAGDMAALLSQTVPRTREMYIRVAVAFRNAKQPDRARECIEEASALFPVDASLLLEYALVCFDLSDIAAARRAVEAGLQRFPDHEAFKALHARFQELREDAP